MPESEAELILDADHGSYSFDAAIGKRDRNARCIHHRSCWMMPVIPFLWLSGFPYHLLLSEHWSSGFSEHLSGGFSNHCHT